MAVPLASSRNRWPNAGFADLRLALGIAIFSKSTAHGHSPEDLASELFNIVNNVPYLPSFPERDFHPLDTQHYGLRKNEDLSPIVFF